MTGVGIRACVLLISIGGLEPKPFAPGVSIDWQRQAIHVDGVVVLREGMLELLACTPNTREHESIIQIQAQARQIYDALGLIGLEPGHPPYWDARTKQVVPAAGPRIRIEITYEDQGEHRCVLAHQWLWDLARDAPCRPLSWVYSGSRLLGPVRLEADIEGTIICVVDFDAALLSLPQSHSADNEALWLGPNTAVIPPLGTPVSLILSKRPEHEQTCYLDRFGRILYADKYRGYIELQWMIREALDAHPDLAVNVEYDPNGQAADRQALDDLLVRAGVRTQQINFEQSGEAAWFRWAQAADTPGQLRSLAEIVDSGSVRISAVQRQLEFCGRWIVDVCAGLNARLRWLERSLLGSMSDPEQQEPKQRARNETVPERD